MTFLDLMIERWQGPDGEDWWARLRRAEDLLRRANAAIGEEP